MLKLQIITITEMIINSYCFQIWLDIPGLRYTSREWHSPNLFSALAWHSKALVNQYLRSGNLLLLSLASIGYWNSLLVLLSGYTLTAGSKSAGDTVTSSQGISAASLAQCRGLLNENHISWKAKYTYVQPTTDVAGWTILLGLLWPWLPQCNKF